MYTAMSFYLSFYIYIFIYQLVYLFIYLYLNYLNVDLVEPQKAKELVQSVKRTVNSLSKQRSLSADSCIDNVVITTIY